MPFSTPLQRTDSWPPTIIHLSHTSNTTSTPTNPPSKPSTHQETLTNTTQQPKSIDEDPFSFFLTSPEDLEDYYSDNDDEEFNAGIEDPSSKTVVVREVSPSSLQRGRENSVVLDMDVDGYAEEEMDEDDGDDDDEGGFGIAIPLSLKEFAMRYSSPRPKGRRASAGDGGRREDDGLGLGLGINIPARGRAKVRLERGRGRSLSNGRKSPVSWREPSPEIWRIEEGEEEDGEGDLVMGGLSMSAPASTHIGSGGLRKRDGGEGKGKKRVHWAV